MIQNIGYNKAKTETVTNITFHKITERIESCKILDVTDDETAIHLLMGIKYTGIVTEPSSPIRNTPHSMSHVFCETKAINYQHNTEATK